MASKYQEMRQRHRESLSAIFSLLVGFYLVYIFWPNLAIIWEAYQRGYQSWNSGALIGNVLISLLPLIVPAIGHWFGLFMFIFGDVYYSLDDEYLGLRKQVDIVIARTLFQVTGLSIPECDLLNAEIRSAYMRVFYRFVDDEKTVNKELVEQVFVHWGNYFGNLSAAFLSILLFLTLVFTMMIAQWRDLTLGLSVLGVFLIIFFIGWLRIRRGSRTQTIILAIPVEEIKQIQLRAATELAQALKDEVLPVMVSKQTQVGSNG